MADSIPLDEYTIYIVDTSEELIFTDPTMELTAIGLEQIGRNILSSDRFELTKQEAEITDSVLITNYSEGLTFNFIESYKEMLSHPEVYNTVELKKQHVEDLEEIKKQNDKTESKWLPLCDRHMFGFMNPKGEKLVYISFEPNYKVKSKYIKSTGERHPTNMVWSIVYSVHKDKLGIRPKYW